MSDARVNTDKGVSKLSTKGVKRVDVGHKGIRAAHEKREPEAAHASIPGPGVQFCRLKFDKQHQDVLPSYDNRLSHALTNSSSHIRAYAYRIREYILDSSDRYPGILTRGCKRLPCLNTHIRLGKPVQIHSILHNFLVELPHHGSLLRVVIPLTVLIFHPKVV